jgi:DNA-binding beta-propeller fold protein YncE
MGHEQHSALHRFRQELPSGTTVYEQGTVRVAFSPAGDQLAVALSAEGAVALLDGQGAVRRVEVGGLPDGLRYDGDTLYAGDLSAGRLTAIDPRAARVTEVLRAGAEVRSTETMLVLEHRGDVAGLVCPLVRQ